MEHALFLYNLFIITLFTICTTIYFWIYRIHKTRVYFWVAIMFACFILDNTILYMVDTIDSFSIYYELMVVQSPIIKTLISIIMFASYRKIAEYLFSDPITKIDYALFGAFILSLFVIPLFPFSRVSFFVYFTINQIAFAYLCIRYWQLNKNKANVELRNKISRILLILFLFNLAIIIEDLIVIFRLDEFVAEYAVRSRVNQRNFMEDLSSIFISLLALYLVFQRSWFIVESKNSENNVQKQINNFVSKHQLTIREREVLQLLLIDKSNQEIADTLYISVGTVKNHVHNIFQKSCMSRRSQLIQSLKNSNNNSEIEISYDKITSQTDLELK